MGAPLRDLVLVSMTAKAKAAKAINLIIRSSHVFKERYS